VPRRRPRHRRRQGPTGAGQGITGTDGPATGRVDPRRDIGAWSQAWPGSSCTVPAAGSPASPGGSSVTVRSRRRVSMNRHPSLRTGPAGGPGSGAATSASPAGPLSPGPGRGAAADGAPGRVSAVPAGALTAGRTAEGRKRPTRCRQRCNQMIMRRWPRRRPGPVGSMAHRVWHQSCVWPVPSPKALCAPWVLALAPNDAAPHGVDVRNDHGCEPASGHPCDTALSLPAEP